MEIVERTSSIEPASVRETRGAAKLVPMFSAEPTARPFSSFNFPLCVRGVLKPRVRVAAELYFIRSLLLCEPGWRP
jgi:hypothetical protein